MTNSLDVEPDLGLNFLQRTCSRSQTSEFYKYFKNFYEQVLYLNVLVFYTVLRSDSLVPCLYYSV